MPGATDAEFLKLLQDYETVIPSWIHQDLKLFLMMSFLLNLQMQAQHAIVWYVHCS